MTCCLACTEASSALYEQPVLCAVYDLFVTADRSCGTRHLTELVQPGQGGHAALRQQLRWPLSHSRLQLVHSAVRLHRHISNLNPLQNALTADIHLHATWVPQ